MKEMSSFTTSMEAARQLSDSLAKAKRDFIEYNVNQWGGDTRIITFIADILFHGAGGVSVENSTETIRSLFEAGYCFYFAKMLEEAFPGGTICLCYDFGHVIYVYDEVAYDICGVTDAEYKYLIPLKVLGDNCKEFKHIPGSSFAEDDAKELAAKYLSENPKGVFAISKHPGCSELIERCKIIFKDNLTSEEQILKVKLECAIRCARHSIKNNTLSWSDYEQLMEEYCFENKLNWRLIKRMHKINKTYA